jgi:HD-like signal output (HDOD) protein
VDNGQQGASLEALVQQIAELRPLTACTLRILEITEAEQFSAHDLATTIASDQAITAKLLRLSNSAYYGFPRRITTIRDAVVLLGFREVRAATIVASLIDNVPDSSNVDYDAFWQFSLTVGMLAEVLARSENAHRDHAFTAGVLHNIGRLGLDQVRPDALTEAIELARRTSISLHDAERRLLGYSDAEVGRDLAERWAFPQPLVAAIGEHAAPLQQLPDPRSLTAFVVRARAFAQSYGLADGVETHDQAEAPSEWTTPPLSVALEQSGGMDRLMERVSAFQDITAAQ